MRILTAGASGFLGTRLVDRLRAEGGHDVTRLVRRAARTGDEASWNPSGGQLDPALVASADAVINLAGAGVGDKRWSAAYKSTMRSSRVDTAGTIARAISHLDPADRPHTLQGSAIGWYGDTGDNRVEEDAPAGSGYFADLCRVWEAAARPAEDAGVRVVLLRTGLALSDDGGLLAPQMLPFKLGIGGKLAGGAQWVPWISLEDWLRAVTFLLARDDIAGPVNIVGPEPVTNAVFTEAFARELHRPAFMPIPGIALKALLGEFGGEITRSQRVIPAVLKNANFTWQHPTLESALREALTPTS